MKIAMFYHTLVSDWNHGNAHFLRGVATELLSRGHELHIYEPKNSWSRLNMAAEHGLKPIQKFHDAYPKLVSTPYEVETIDLDEVLDNADLVIVHEWNDHSLVRRIGEHRERFGDYKLLFHDTHHRMMTDRKSMDAYDLSNYDGVLAYGNVLKELYEQAGSVARAWTWHEAADTRVFRLIQEQELEGDIVWIGNWGDEERTEELRNYLIEPIKNLALKGRVYGVRYPAEAQTALTEAGIEYAGWLPNFEVPKVFAAFKATVHVPRRPYVQALPGIPTIRVFEALACGIPLICSPWNDVEGLFHPGKDYLVARDQAEMEKHLWEVLNDRELARSLSENGLRTIRLRHTCSHRVDELLNIYSELNSRKEIETQELTAV
jgi:spore maturation protein CgeB